MGVVFGHSLNKHVITLRVTSTISKWV